MNHSVNNAKKWLTKAAIRGSAEAAELLEKIDNGEFK